MSVIATVPQILAMFNGPITHSMLERGSVIYDEEPLQRIWRDMNAAAAQNAFGRERSATRFGRALRGEFDVVVALYHDQGLAPLKTIDFDESVNVTLGLPFVRTSPDHGTAYGIAGRGLASPRSFANAVTIARRLVAAR